MEPPKDRFRDIVFEVVLAVLAAFAVSILIHAARQLIF